MNDSTYVLVYEINSKTIIVAKSRNYAYIKQSKATHDKTLGTTGVIKKLRKA